MLGALVYSGSHIAVYCTIAGLYAVGWRILLDASLYAASVLWCDGWGWMIKIVCNFLVK